MICSEEYKEHIEYTFAAFCKAVLWFRMETEMGSAAWIHNIQNTAWTAHNGYLFWAIQSSDCLCGERTTFFFFLFPKKKASIYDIMVLFI